jgi:hypothetical protein
MLAERIALILFCVALRTDVLRESRNCVSGRFVGRGRAFYGANKAAMPTQNRYDELRQAFQTEMQQYIQEGFRPNDCFPFVFQNIIESTGLPAADRADLQRELQEWTRKIM